MAAERSAYVCSVLALAAVAQAADFRTTGIAFWGRDYAGRA